MSEYENKSVDELIELLEDRDMKIEELEQEVEEGECVMTDLRFELSQVEEEDEPEDIAERAFDAGFNAGTGLENQMKSWLNYKIEARL